MYIRNVKSVPVAPREAELIDTIESYDLVVFRPRDVARWLDISRRNAYRILGNMADKGLITRLQQGVYTLTDTYESADAYELATALEPASYLAFWSALHFHRRTDQVPRTIFLATTTQKRPLEIQGQRVTFVRIATDAFFGYERHGSVVVSDLEKTIIDALRHPDYAGGISHIDRAMGDDLDGTILTEYASRLGSGAVAARLGYLCDRHGIDIDRAALKGLIGSYVPLDPTGDRTNLDPQWRLYVNVTLDA